MELPSHSNCVPTPNVRARQNKTIHGPANEDMSHWKTNITSLCNDKNPLEAFAAECAQDKYTHKESSQNFQKLVPSSQNVLTKGNFRDFQFLDLQRHSEYADFESQSQPVLLYDNEYINMYLSQAFNIGREKERSCILFRQNNTLKLSTGHSTQKRVLLPSKRNNRFQTGASKDGDRLESGPAIISQGGRSIIFSEQLTKVMLDVI